MKIESTDEDVRTLLSSAYYRIPRFQRPYSWEREHIQEFWDDVVRDSTSDYFIGSMVVYREGKQAFGVVDGQQRLSTIIVLLCVLRNVADELGFGDLAGGIHGLVEKKNVDNKMEFTLSTESSYPFFQDHILKFGKPEIDVKPLKEEENLQRAHDQLNGLVRAVVSGIQSDPSLNEVSRAQTLQKRLTAIRDAILDLKLIRVKLDDEDDAYVIFETLNTRGKDLGLSDLVKNHITKQLKTKSASVDQTKVKWQKILETIQGSSVPIDCDAFLHHFWLSKYEYLPAKEVFRVLKKQVTKSTAKSFLDALVTDSASYRSIHETSYGKWTKEQARIEQALSALMLFKVRQQTPCVLSLVRSFRNGKVKKKHLEDALVAIERFHFLFTAVTSQRSSGGISKMYAALGRRVDQAPDTQAAADVIRDLKVKLRDLLPTLEEVQALFPELVYTDTLSKERKLVHYALVGLYRGEASPVTIDYDNMTIEHLVPQSAIGTGDFTDAIVGQLGNLLLVSHELNDKLKDKSFKEKKQIMIDAKYDLPPEIASATDWTKDLIRTRTLSMAKDAYNKVWKI